MHIFVLFQVKSLELKLIVGESREDEKKMKGPEASKASLIFPHSTKAEAVVERGP